MNRTLERAVFGAIGAIAPDILILYSKRFTMSALTFVQWQYWMATLLYLGLAAIVASIYPYKGRGTRWKAMAVGFSLPIVLASLATALRGNLVSPRGTSLSGTLLDMMSLF